MLDADLLACANPDHLFELLGAVHGPVHGGALVDGPAAPALYAVPNFRLKKRRFGDASSNFNAGVMVVPSPMADDAAALASLVASATDDDTEELLLNRLFKGRWAALPEGYNVPKRVAVHAPDLWRALVNGGGGGGGNGHVAGPGDVGSGDGGGDGGGGDGDGGGGGGGGGGGPSAVSSATVGSSFQQGVVFMHYMGAKPWMNPEARANADWEEPGLYEWLEEVWWEVRNSETPPRGGIGGVGGRPAERIALPAACAPP